MDTIQKLENAGMNKPTIMELSTPAVSDSVATRNGGSLQLNQTGENLLFKMEQESSDKQHEKIMQIAAIVAAVGAILSALLLGIQTISHLSM